MTLSNPSGAGLADATATGTITDDDSTPGGPDEGPDAGPDGESAPLELDSLQVTGAASDMYPAFAADTHHYALACNDSTTLGVTARAKRSGAQLTLLRAAPNDNHQSTGNLDVRVTVNQNHDLAIELSDAGGTVTYVVHCVPTGFPDIRILTRTAGVTDRAAVHDTVLWIRWQQSRDRLHRDPRQQRSPSLPATEHLAPRAEELQATCSGGLLGFPRSGSRSHRWRLGGGSARRAVCRHGHRVDGLTADQHRWARLPDYRKRQLPVLRLSAGDPRLQHVHRPERRSLLVAGACIRFGDSGSGAGRGRGLHLELVGSSEDRSGPAASCCSRRIMLISTRCN